MKRSLPYMFYGSVVFTILTQVHGVKRIWKPRNDFDSVRSWSNGQSPCFGDEATLAENSVMLLEKYHALSTLNLPAEGELIMAEGSVLEIVDVASFTQQRDKYLARQADPAPPASCRQNSGPKKVSSMVTSNSWYDPKNWKLDEDESIASGSYSVLDSERIPCNGDDVYFPSGHTIQITMPSTLLKPIYLRTFKIGSLSINQDTMGEYFSKPEVSLMFSTDNESNRSIAAALAKDSDTEKMGVPFMKIGEDELAPVCDVEYGCKCGNDRREIMEKICPFLHEETNKTAHISCAKPVYAVGKCQPFCGAVVTFLPKQMYPALHQVDNILRQLPSGYKNSLDIHTTVMDDLSIQTVFMHSRLIDWEDNEPTYTAAAAAYSFFDKLKNGTEPGEVSFVDENTLVLVVSDTPKASASVSQAHTASASKSGIVAAVVATVVIVIAIILTALFVLWRKRRGLGFGFRSLESDANRDTLEMEGADFQNPLFHAGTASLTLRSKSGRARRKGDRTQLLEDDTNGLYDVDEPDLYPGDHSEWQSTSTFGPYSEPTSEAETEFSSRTL
ncbi:protein amnionless-like [Paramacrobiotus metropolitanus]|uniref:protein amnionless-like n=1 Tax=Paramacrobiotus metropolitanus TaxID=2943436 RepID=UPI002445781C|nr:protein amnionless-like [Paramacrobiotus metropolitanus]